MIKIETMTELSSFVVRRGVSQIEFAQGSPYDAALADFQDLRISVAWPEVKRLAQRIGCRISEDTIYPRTQEDYNRLLIFCAVRPITPQSWIPDLIKVVLGLNGYDITYWSMHFKRAFWSDTNETSLARTATGFKHLFGLI